MKTRYVPGHAICRMHNFTCTVKGMRCTYYLKNLYRPCFRRVDFISFGPRPLQSGFDLCQHCRCLYLLFPYFLLVCFDGCDDLRLLALLPVNFPCTFLHIYVGIDLGKYSDLQEISFVTSLDVVARFLHVFIWWPVRKN